MQTHTTRGGLSLARLERLTRGIEGYVERGEIAGAVALVHRHSETAYYEAIGWQDDAERTPMRRDTIFRIASMTKPVAAVAMLMLLEEGKLRLDDPVERWLPELANRRVLRDPAGPLDDTYPAPRSITVCDLATHRPGLVSHFTAQGPIAAEAMALTSNMLRLNDALDADTFLQRLGALPLVHEPGARMNYGFTTDVLGILLARAAGQPLEKFLQERLFEPLGMVDTGFWVPAEKRSRFATAYEIDPSSGARQLNDHPDRSLWSAMPGTPSAAAGLVSTADDYLRFAQMLMAGGRLDGERILSRKSIELMTSDFLTPEQRKHAFFMIPDFWAGQGFGLNVTVLDKLGQQAGLGSVGKYGWSGAYGTWWFNDPQENMIGLLMFQLFNAEAFCKIRPDFENLVYQSIDD